MSDNSSSPNQMAPILVNRSARALMRAQLRLDLQESRTGLRREREVSAAAAAVRAPRWRSARHLPLSGAPKSGVAGPASNEQEQPLAAQHMATPDETGAAPELDMSLQADVDLSQDGGSVFAGLMGELAHVHPQGSELGAVDETLDDPNAGLAAPGSSEVSSAAPANASDLAPEAAQAVENHAPAITITALGPGMLARLRLLGYDRITDLADADPVALRHGLGDISRLLNVEGWIAEARRIAESDNPTPL